MTTRRSFLQVLFGAPAATLLPTAKEVEAKAAPEFEPTIEEIPSFQGPVTAVRTEVFPGVFLVGSDVAYVKEPVMQYTKLPKDKP